jgi:cytochrome c-type biogenesis protein CcsB
MERVLEALRIGRGVGFTLAVVLGMLVVMTPSARAQSAPAGNEHPVSEAVAVDTRELPSPFGDDHSGRRTVEDKRALAAAVDLEQLRTLAVLHEGRVKILDTLARETVQRIAGRKNYFDLEPAGSGDKARKIHYDPLFTFMDLMIDPVYYLDKPLVHVEYLPLRRAFVEAAYPEDKARQERWLKLTRLAPSDIARHGAAIQTRYEFEAPYRAAIHNVARALDLYQWSSANLRMVAPSRADDKYIHLSALQESTPARQAALKLGAAWRAGDAAGVNAAIGVLAEQLPAMNEHVYPTTRRQIEHFYNRANAFEYGYWAYLLALVSLILAFGTGRRWLIGAGVAMLTLAILLHGAGFAARCIIAERFAIQNQFESMTGVSLFGALVGMAVMLVKRQWLYGAAAAGVGFLILVTATQTAIPGKFIEREAAILNTSVLLKYHVTTVLMSYGLITLGFLISVFYLVTYYAAKLRGGTGGAAADAGITREKMVRVLPGAPEAMMATALNIDSTEPVGTARTLSDLDKATMTVLQLAFWTLAVGILLGAWWADHSWGRWWAFDPKEAWALVTWIVYLAVIHLRFTMTKNRALVTAWLSILGFLIMLWTYFGVNLLLPGLHAYA